MVPRRPLTSVSLWRLPSFDCAWIWSHHQVCPGETGTRVKSRVSFHERYRRKSLSMFFSQKSDRNLDLFIIDWHRVYTMWGVHCWRPARQQCRSNCCRQVRWTYWNGYFRLMERNFSKRFSIYRSFVWDRDATPIYQPVWPPIHKYRGFIPRVLEFCVSHLSSFLSFRLLWFVMAKSVDRLTYLTIRYGGSMRAWVDVGYSTADTNWIWE